MLTIFNIHGVD